MTSVILASPFLLTLYGAALFFCVFDLLKRATGYVFSLLSAGIFVCATVFAVLLSAGISEITITVLLFLVLNLLSYSVKKGGKK